MHALILREKRNKYWAGPGSPIILWKSGESNATAPGLDPVLTTFFTTGVLAKEIGAAIISLEHRYWGKSSPFVEQTTANLQHLTVENAMQDMINFARHVELPFANGNSSNAAEVPWVLAGDSYSGGLTSWIANLYPGTFWAYLASSAVVQGIANYWEFWEPAREHMPKNCTKDINLVVEHLDHILETGTAAEKRKAKALFELESLQDDDFMVALQWGPAIWQNSNFFLGSAPTEAFCDHVENAAHEKDPAKLPGADGVGLEKALAGYARWWNKSGYSDARCKFIDGEYVCNYPNKKYLCFETHDPRHPRYMDVTVGNNWWWRQWNWMECNELFGWWAVAPPKGQPTLISRLINREYYVRQCDLAFPPGPNGETYGLNRGRTVADLNDYTGGWFAQNASRIFYANGGYDLWRTVSVSSQFRPGGPMESTPQAPVRVIPHGFHETDLFSWNAKADAGDKAVRNEEVAQIAEWVKEWPGYGDR